VPKHCTYLHALGVALLLSADPAVIGQFRSKPG